jgi:iron complex outermembrane receptor protein
MYMPGGEMQKSTLVGSIVIGALFAQGVAAEAPPAAETAVEEIVVTARKREETLQEAPLAISVISAEQIRNTGVSRVTDAAARLPNVSALDQPAGVGTFGFSPYIRGINTGARSIGFESGFGIFLNGAYAGRNETANKFLPDVERIEFLPGPQATTFGKNTTVGVMNIVTRKPSANWEGAAEASLGNHGSREYRATASGPLSDNWGISLAAGKREYDGYYRNVIPLERQFFDPDGRFDGRDGPTFDSLGGSIEITARGERTSADLLVDYTDSERGNDVYLARVEGFDALPVDVRESATMGTHKTRDFGGVLNITHEVGPGSLTAITAYRDFNSNIPFDGDAYAYPMQEGPEWRTTQELVSQEIRYAGNAGPFDYLFGAYWQDQESTTAKVADIFGLASVRITGAIESETISTFANVEYEITDQWSTEVGLRWEDEEKRMPYFTQTGGELLGVLPINEGPLERNVSHLSYTAMLAYAVNDRINTHARYSKGYKSGGYNIDFVTSPVLTPLEFDDESADNYELGAKMQLTDSLFVNAVYFLTNYHDLQQSEYTTVPGQPLPVITTKNAGEARTDGIELNVSYAAERFTVNGNLGTADARYTKWLRQTATGFSDEKGEKFPAPDLTFNFFGEYRIPLGEHQLTLIGEYIYRSEAPQAVTMPKGPIVPSDPDSPLRPSYHADSVDVLNFRVRLDLGSHWSLTAWVRNALDDRAVTFRQPNDAEGFYEAFGLFSPYDIRRQVTGDYQSPRHYGIDVRYQFGD